MVKRVYLAADHAGFQMKEAVKGILLTSGYEVVDKGAKRLDSEDDYPDFMRPAALALAGDSDAVGIFFGGSGEGEAIIANRFPGIRAAVYYGGPREIITLSREHNDANVLSLGARFIKLEEIKEIILLWLTTKFSSEERHRRRIAKIDAGV